MRTKKIVWMVGALIMMSGIVSQASLLTNGSFEDGERFAWPGYASGGEIPGWTYSGSFVGISPALDGRHEFDSSLAVPDGLNIAFIQNTGSLSQDVALEPGNYVLSWCEGHCARYNDDPSRMVRVKDSLGTVIESATEVVTITGAYVCKTLTFTISESDTYTVSFSSIPSSGGSAVYLLDNVKLMMISESLINGSFEDGERFAWPGYASGGEIPGWTYSGPFVGISPASDGRHEFDSSLVVPDGLNVAFIQNTGSLSQDIGLAPGNYVLSWCEAHCTRYNDDPSRTVSIKDSVGTVIQSATEVVTNPGAYVFIYACKSITFTVTESGIYTLSFSSLPSSGGSAVYLLDNVKLMMINESLINGSFEDGERFAYPGYASGGEIPGWTYSGSFVGISPSANGVYEFTYTLAIPDGSNVAFIQNTGSLSQDIALDTSGEYVLSWYEARRPSSVADDPSRTVAVKDSVGTVIQSATEVVTNTDVYVRKTMTITVSEDGIYTLSFSSLPATGGSTAYLLDNVYLDHVMVKAPVFSPSEKYISGPTAITITCETPGASIYYTTDGSEPTSASTSYAGTVTVDDYTTLKAVAIADGDNSHVASTTYYNVPETGRGKWWVKNHPFQINGLVGCSGDISQYQDIGFSSFMVAGPSMDIAGIPGKTLGAASKAGLGWHFFYQWNTESADEFISDLTNYIDLYPGCLGVNVGDENNTDDYSSIAVQIQEVKTLIPEAIVYHAQLVKSDNTEFRTYLDQAVNILHVDVLMYDQYPFNGGSTASDFYDNLGIVRERALNAGIPYWNWLQGHGWDNDGALRQDPSESEIRLQAFMSLAYGYSGLSYWTYDGTYPPYTDAILNSSGTLSSIGEAVDGATDEIKNIGNVTKDLTSTGVFYVTASGESQPTGTSAWTTQTGYPISTVAVTSGSKGFVVGLFTDDEGNKYFMVVNGNHAAYTSAADTTATVTITFDSSVDEITLINRSTGESETVTLTNHTLSSYSLPGGTGDLFCLTATSEPIPGDANLDGKVDVGDLGILAANYGRNLQSEGVDESLWWGLGDFTGDGRVDVGDLGVLAANYGTGSSSACDFDADYTKVFGDATDDSSDDESTSTLCSSLGLSLIAGLALMGLMIVKLKE